MTKFANPRAARPYSGSPWATNASAAMTSTMTMNEDAFGGAEDFSSPSSVTPGGSFHSSSTFDHLLEAVPVVHHGIVL